MEQLKYVNAIGQEITFSQNSKYRWLSIEDLGGNNVTFQTVSSPYQDGVTFIGTPYFQSKKLALSFAILSDSLIADMRYLNQILNPKLGLGQLHYIRGGITYVLDQIIVSNLPSLLGSENRGSYYQKSNLIFDVFNPLFTDLDYTTATIGSGQLLFEFPLNITDEFEFAVINAEGVIVNNVGDVEAPILIEITGEATSPLTIENVTNGGKIVVGLSLTSDEKLIITTDVDNTNVIKETISTGVQTTAFNYIDITQTDFFKVDRGNNQIIITNLSSEIVGATVQYKNRYVGV
jgi:hypothetical protein